LPSQGRDDAAENSDQIFIDLVDGELRPAYRLASFLLGDVVEAEDATQDAILQAWRSWPQLRESASFPGWFERILVNVCYGRLRQRRRAKLVELPGTPESLAMDPTRSMADRDEVGRSLSALTPEQRVVVVLRYWRDMTVPEIAIRLNLPPGTIKSRLHYGLAAIRTHMAAASEVVR
jgi:RNA polymerase sigma-70 factor (ECF subfamily)